MVVERTAQLIAGPSTYFLNTFSIGSYPELVRAREARETYLGKWPAFCVGLLRVLADGTPSKVTIDGQHRRLWLLFAGNGRYDPPGFAPSYRRSLDDGLLDIRAVDGRHPFARTRLVTAFLTGTLDRSRVYQATTVTRLRIGGMGEKGDYTRDGEVSPARRHAHPRQVTPRAHRLPTRAALTPAPSGCAALRSGRQHTWQRPGQPVGTTAGSQGAAGPVFEIHAAGYSE
ncbi:diacylglycerol/lipid kinase family protein [Streptomyces sp. NPDC002870]|uniref:diacylglycerol/lipid kinase family protein n=1 Tax=Streptomyces sp. NPDC002870 TaxID=3364666 RepID=UPI0036B21E25